MKRTFKNSAPGAPSQMIRFFEAVLNVVREVSAPDDPVESYIDEQVIEAVDAIDIITNGKRNVPNNYIEFSNGDYTVRVDFKVTIIS